MAQHGDMERAFTLLEVMLSVVIIGALTALSLPLYRSFLIRNDLDVTAEQVASSLRRAQTYARGVNGDSNWSVEIAASAFTLFKGTNFAVRDTSFDEVTTLPGTITASGTSEVQFAKLSATPNVAGSITLTTSTGQTKVITINAKGMVNY